MKNFDWTQFTLKIAVKAKPSIIYNAWTTAWEIEKWFLSGCKFICGGPTIDRETQVEAGCSYEWNWFLYDITEYGKITVANGKDFFQFTFAGDCLVDIKLKEEGEYTIVELTQHNIPTDDESKQGIRLGCHTGWSFYLLNLKSVYEGGIDLRNKDRNLKSMVNN